MSELQGDLVSNTFGGAPFQQTWNDLPIWEHFFNRYPCKAMVDLGTGVGGMALYFACQTFMREMRYTTIDKERICEPRVIRLLHDLGAQDRLLHAFKNADSIAQIIADQPRPLILFLDNGDKPKEAATFGPLLRPGDFLAVHDWSDTTGVGEIGPSDVPPHFQMLLKDECRSTDSITRFFLRE